MHVHIQCADGEAKFWLEPAIELAKNYRLSDRQISAIRGLIEVHADEFRSAWTYQRRMSRKVKFSQNWLKARRRVQRIHTRIAHGRKDFLHQATSTISKTHAIVCIEDLQVRNMSRSGRGTTVAPGGHVALKSGLNKSILDQGWYEFRRQLEYKLAWNGGQLIAVPPHHTSQTCPACQHVSSENRRSQVTFRCIECGYENHADVVGAINILERGLCLSACEEEGAGLARKRKTKPASKKQEPTEETHAIVA